MAEKDSSDRDRKPGPDPSDDAIKLLRLIRLRREPFATATDLVEKTQVGRKQTRNRLNDLVEAGLLDVELVGTTKVYWLTDKGKKRLAEAS